MATAMISSKGQITLPAAARRKLNIKPKSRVEVEVRETEIVIRPAKTIRDVMGIFHDYAKGKTEDWETVRSLTERAVAEEVMDEG
jgi:AbrB family looped-hinge helix DNA binding protein